MAEYEEKIKEMKVDTHLQLLEIETESGRTFLVELTAA